MGSPYEIHCETARELIEHLSPLNPIWDAGTFIFRGQGSDDFKLTPSICRRGPGSFADGTPRKAFAYTARNQVNLELEVLRRFLSGCDRSGLAVPGYTEQIKRKMAKEQHFFLSAADPWPQQNMYEIMAVAQHYDVPTRLLDWTERSFVACYFAASSANFELDNGKERIAIWALDTSNSDDWNTVSIIRTPGGTSRNQAAQSGLFTTHKVKDYGFEPYQPEALEDVQEIYGEGATARSLFKFTLPVEQAPELLTMCSKFGVDASTLFPGFHGVAKNVKDWVNLEIGVRPSPSMMDDRYHDAYYD
ncbi:FRG domain-containing protein [Pseudomonas mosselii]|uniref:FRG domain-containing protein n=1 Tax=Pseudomonas mosselii TaxID=78327 RepID=UPI001F4C4FC5|nr:FRG domain-containing protein [Pseudomonas mosselii]MCH7420700.1 FRG domain-containing protein [Pseudomonas mosselii]